jgi:hypothetical protein
VRVQAIGKGNALTSPTCNENNAQHYITHFAVRPIDVHSRPGPFSEPSSIHLMAMK